MHAPKPPPDIEEQLLAVARQRQKEMEMLQEQRQKQIEQMRKQQEEAIAKAKRKEKVRKAKEIAKKVGKTGLNIADAMLRDPSIPYRRAPLPGLLP
jgi:hypothetical protein